MSQPDLLIRVGPVRGRENRMRTLTAAVLTALIASLAATC